MNLELNLVKSQSIYAKAFSILARKRVLVGNDTEAMAAIEAFIAENIDIFDAAMTNKAMVSQLQNLKDLTIDTLYSLKFMMAASGIDLIFFSVSDAESDGDGISDGIVEYNVIDNLNASSNFIKFATKLPVSENGGNLAEVYKRIIDMFGFFEGDLFTGYTDPLKTQLEILSQTEKALGVTPSAITSYLNSVLEYLGKDLIVIMN